MCMHPCMLMFVYCVRDTLIKSITHATRNRVCILDSRNGIHHKATIGAAAVRDGYAGTLPSSWSALSHLQVLDLSNNKLSGPLPDSWSQMMTVSYMILDSNNLAGTVPASWARLTSLLLIVLDHNVRLTGCLPRAWRAMSGAAQTTRQSSNASDSLLGQILSASPVAHERTYEGTSITGYC
jgi:hypothetical protein